MKKLSLAALAVAVTALTACNTQTTVLPEETKKEPVTSSVNGTVEITEPPMEVSTSGSITIEGAATDTTEAPVVDTTDSPVAEGTTPVVTVEPVTTETPAVNSAE